MIILVLKLFRKELIKLLFTFLFTFIAIASTLFLIPISKNLPTVFSSTSVFDFVKLSFLVVLIYFIRGLFTYLQNYLTGYISVKLASEIRSELYQLLLKSKFQFFYQYKSGELTTLIINDTYKLKEMFFTIISELIPSIITLIATLSYIFYLNWKLSLFVILLVPCIGLLISFFSRLIEEKAKNIQNKIAESYSTINENFINYLALKVFSLETLKTLEFKALEHKNNKENLALINLVSLQPSLIGLVQVIGISIIACFGGYQMANKSISLPELIAFGTALSLTIEPAIFLTKALGIISTSKASLQRILEFKQTIILDSEKEGIEFFESYDITIKELSFAYHENSPKVLSALNLEIPQGSCIAISGDNGKGKSTILKLLLGFYDNYEGFIKIGKHELKNYSYKALRKELKACFHEPFLFNTTIRENILLGLEDKKDIDNLLAKVCEITRIDELLENIKSDLDYELGYAGNNLSSGQKQRISIARAIISKPKILILDEATSALDLDTEAHIYQAIRAFLPTTTIIIVNHRKESLVRNGINSISLEQV